jgi:Trk-type K+ transport system membrane component
VFVGFFQGGVQPRTAGFNSIDYAQAHETSLLVTDGLMFIGAGSAGTGGGIKVTTFFLLAFVILAEIAGDRDVTVAHRRVPGETQRQALTVALLGVAVVAVGTLVLLMISPYRFDLLLFEATSAFSTAGLTTGITSTMSAPEHGVLMLLMFVGRVGTVTVASALALRSRQRLYQLPDERPIVG